MNIQSEVPSLELCREMKELGFPQEGIWYWSEDHVVRPMAKHEPLDSWILAPTVVQMYSMLPQMFYAYLDFDCSYYHCDVFKGNHFEFEDKVQHQTADTLPNVLAKMLIHLAKQGLIEPKGLS